MFEAGESFTSF